MRQLLFYLIIGLAAALLFFFFTQRLATNLKASLQTSQDLQDQMDWEQENVNKSLIEQEEVYQEEIYQEQLRLIETYSDIITEREANYLEMLGRHSPEIRDQFPHVTMIELWDAIYQRELDYLRKHGRISQRILDQLKESREQAEAVERIFGNLEEQTR